MEDFSHFEIPKCVYLGTLYLYLILGIPGFSYLYRIFIECFSLKVLTLDCTDEILNAFQTLGSKKS